MKQRPYNEEEVPSSGVDGLEAKRVPGGPHHNRREAFGKPGKSFQKQLKNGLRGQKTIWHTRFPTLKKKPKDSETTPPGSRGCRGRSSRPDTCERNTLTPAFG